MWPSGRILTTTELEPRPADATESSDPFAPWYEAREHFHDSNHAWFGSYHIQAYTAEEAVAKARKMEATCSRSVTAG